MRRTARRKTTIKEKKRKKNASLALDKALRSKTAGNRKQERGNEIPWSVRDTKQCEFLLGVSFSLPQISFLALFLSPYDTGHEGPLTGYFVRKDAPMILETLLTAIVYPWTSSGPMLGAVQSVRQHRRICSTIASAGPGMARPSTLSGFNAYGTSMCMLSCAVLTVHAGHARAASYVIAMVRSMHSC